MKRKYCIHCKEEIDWDDWARSVLHPIESIWNSKKYCSSLCSKKYNHAKAKAKKNKGKVVR